jgi:hypothetical protein
VGPGRQPNRELYPHWKGDAAAAAFEMQEAGLKKELEGLLGIMDENEFHPWVVPRADAYAAAGKELKDSTGAASLDEDVSEDDLRSLVRELIWMKTTTVPAMWGIVQVPRNARRPRTSWRARLRSLAEC